MARYTIEYPIFITDADLNAQYQAQFPDGVPGAPSTIATTYAAPINAAPPVYGEGQCIWIQAENSPFLHSVAGGTIAPGFIYSPDNTNPLQPFASSPGGTWEWRGHFIRRGAVSANPTKEALQTHRWMHGFERATQGEQNTGSASQQFTRDASRTLDGLGFAMRGLANSNVAMTMPTTGTGFPTAFSWERFYVRVRRYPSAYEMFWGCKGSIEGGTAALLQVGPTGTLRIYNKGNQVYPGTLTQEGGHLPLNQWVRVDLLINFARASSAGVGDGGLSVYINGTFAMQMANAGGSGGLRNQIQTHASSYLGNENTPTNNLLMDVDDWTNKTQPQLFTGDDWILGSHIQPLALTGFGPGHSGTWVGDWRTLDGIPVNGQNDNLTGTGASGPIEVTTDYIDRQAGCSGLQLSMFVQNASGTTEQLGYSFNGAGFTNISVSTSSAAWAGIIGTTMAQVLYSTGGLQTAPALSNVSVRYTPDGSGGVRKINVITANAEYLGILGDEDCINLQNPGASPPRQGSHNAPYFDGFTGQTAFTKGPGIVEVMSGVYTGNGLGQDIVMQQPSHFIWIRPLTGGTGGGRWFSSMLGGHDPLKETPDKENLVRALQTSNSAGPTGYKFRISGAQANSNALGVVYQWVAFSDRTMRFCLNGAYLFNSSTTTDSVPLFDTAFTPLAGFLLPEIGVGVSTTGFYYKGPGHAANAASLMDSAEAASVCAFSTGLIQPKTILNLDSSQTAFSLWRATDGDGVSGPVAITNYTGDGTGARNIAVALGGRSPIFAIVQPHNGVAYVRDPSHTGSNSTPINSPSTSTTAITGGAANQISVAATLNANGVVYDVFVLAGSVAAGWTTNPTEPIPETDPIPPTADFPPSSMNGWWTSTLGFAGSADVSAYPPNNPRDARDWQKINVFATGNAGFHGGFPGPGCMVDNFFIYAGNDYVVGSTQPTIRVFDGLSDRSLITIPDVAGVKAIAIMAMVAVGPTIYLTTLDSGTSASTWTGRVFSFDPISLTLTQLGSGFTGGEVPYCLCWHMNRLFLGTNKGSGATGKVYFFRPGIDLAWTTDFTATTAGGGSSVMSMSSYGGLLYVGLSSLAADGTNTIKVRSTAGAYTTSYTAVVGSTFRTSNGFPAMLVFNDKLYATYWNPDTVADSYIVRLDVALSPLWAKVYTGAGSTLRPFVALFESQKVLYAVGGGSALSAALVSSSDGNTWTNLTGFLSGPTTTETALPIVGKLGA